MLGVKFSLPGFSRQERCEIGLRSFGKGNSDVSGLGIGMHLAQFNAGGNPPFWGRPFKSLVSHHSWPFITLLMMFSYDLPSIPVTKCILLLWVELVISCAVIGLSVSMRSFCDSSRKFVGSGGGRHYYGSTSPKGCGTSP